MPSPQTTELDFRRCVEVLRRRKAVVAVSMVFLVGAATAFSLLQPEKYQGEARVLLSPDRSGSLFAGQSSIDPELALETEIQVLKSAPVRSAVIEEMGHVPKVGAERVGQTLMIKVLARDKDPERAAATANAYARAYIDFRRSQLVDDLVSAGTDIQSRISDLDRQIDTLNAEVAAAPQASRADVESRLRSRRDGVLQQRALFSQRLDELQIQAAIRTGEARLLAAAPVPESPIGPKPVRVAILALVLGFLSGVGLAALAEFLDETLKSRDDLASAVNGLPILGLIPTIPNDRRSSAGSLVVPADTGSPLAEAYRSLRTSVQLLGVERPLLVIQITSPKPNEGKTTTVGNLAVAIAQSGDRVVVVDADLRHGALSGMFEIPGSAAGLVDVLAGDVSLVDAVQEVTVGGVCLSVLPAGWVPPNPSELLSSRRLAEVLFELGDRFDRVVVDSPPVLPVTDAVCLSNWVDATILLASAGHTRKRDLRLALEMFAQVGASFAGVVLTRADEREGYGYGYGYGTAANARGSRAGRLSRRSRSRGPLVEGRRTGPMRTSSGSGGEAANAAAPDGAVAGADHASPSRPVEEVATVPTEGQGLSRGPLTPG